MKIFSLSRWGRISVFVVMGFVLLCVPRVSRAANLNLQFQQPLVSTAEKFKVCLKTCAINLAACFVQNPAAVTAPTTPLDACRSKVNSCVTACNGTYTTSCEDRCATALQGCMVQAAASGKVEQKTACHTSNKACLLKACSINTSGLSVDYCSKQCTRAYDICSVGGGMSGVVCSSVKNLCVAACPAANVRSFGAISIVQSRVQLRSDFDRTISSLRGLNVNLKAFDLSLRRLSILSCPENVVVCEKTYKACSAKVSSFDQAWDQKLFEAKNECIQTCTDEPESCFGLLKEVCKAKQEKECGCTGNAVGTQTCKQDGSGYNDCVCKPVQVCTPKSAASCDCESVTAVMTGEKVCADDGSGYGSCVCKVASSTPPPTPPAPPPQTPQNCYAQASTACVGTGYVQNYMYLCALQYPTGNWWTGSIWTGCVMGEPTCPCPTTPPAQGSCIAGQTETVSCSDPNTAPQGGYLVKKCADGTWVPGPCTPFPICDPNIPNQGQCIQPS